MNTLDWNKYHKSCPVSPVGEHGTVWESMPAAGSINHILSKWLSWKTFFSQPGAKQRSDTGEWSDAATTIQQHCTANRCLEKTKYKSNGLKDLFQGFDTSVCQTQSMSFRKFALDCLLFNVSNDMCTLANCPLLTPLISIIPSQCPHRG